MSPVLPSPSSVPSLVLCPVFPWWLTQVNGDVGVRDPSPPREGQSSAGVGIGVQHFTGTPITAPGGAVELVGGGVLGDPAVAGSW